MIKRTITLLFALALCTMGFAQKPDPQNPGTQCHINTHPTKNANITSSQIQYWVGTGDSTAILVVSWDQSTALAWGFRWSAGQAYTADQMMDSLQTADSRLTINGGSSTGTFVNTISYSDGSVSYNDDGSSYWMYQVSNAGMAQVGISGWNVHNGDVIEWQYVSDWSDPFPTVSVTPVTNPNGGSTATTPVEADIDSAAILYWVGAGSNYAKYIVNWADTTLAWGYRFSSDSVSVMSMMNDIQSADPRFSFIGSSFISDINFVEGTDTLGISAGQYWSYNVDGIGAMNYADAEYIHSGSMVKFGDPSVATVTDSMEWSGVWYPSAMVWEDSVYPVSVPHGSFDGAVGTDRCLAIAANSNDIKAWATTCTLDLGYQNIATQQARVSYGTAEDATGAVDMSNNLSVVSLGDGGSATVTFDGYITNGDGPDFCVFENAFNDSFLELAFVEVSSDGEHFVRFPAISETQTVAQTGSIGSTDPTMLYNLAGKYRMGYGTPFDLSELADSANLDINHITHVRIVDVVGSIDPQYATYDSHGNMINDPWPTESYSSGFDLDGVGVLHFTAESNGIAETENAAMEVYPNPANGIINISYGNGESFTAQLFDLTGRQLMQAQGSNAIRLDLGNLANGVYMLRIGTSVEKIVVRH